MSILSSLDACFWLLESKTRPQNIAAIAFAVSYVQKSELSARIKKLLPLYPRLTLDIKTNKPLTHTSFEPLEINTSDSIEKVVAEIMMADDFLQGKLWNIYLLQNDSTKMSQILFKLHHSFADGVTGLSFFHHLLFNYVKKEKNEGNNKINFRYLPAFIKESYSLLKIRPKLLPESRNRRVHFLSIPWTIAKPFVSKYRISLHIFSIYIAATIYQSIFPSAVRARFLVPVALQLHNKIGVLGNFIGASRIDLELEDRNILKSIEQQLTLSLKKERWFAYYYFSKLVSAASRVSPSIARRASSWASRRIDAIVTSLSFNQLGTFDEHTNIFHEFAIPALMPGQQLAFGFLKTKEHVNITIISDGTLHYDPFDFITLLKTKGLTCISHA